MKNNFYCDSDTDFYFWFLGLLPLFRHSLKFSWLLNLFAISAGFSLSPIFFILVIPAAVAYVIVDPQHIFICSIFKVRFCNFKVFAYLKSVFLALLISYVVITI